MSVVRRTDFNGKDHATDGVASAKLNLFALCQVTTEDGKTNNLEEVRSLVTERNGNAPRRATLQDTDNNK